MESYPNSTIATTAADTQMNRVQVWKSALKTSNGSFAEHPHTCSDTALGALCKSLRKTVLKETPFPETCHCWLARLPESAVSPHTHLERASLR